jgi:hypothetical protein
VVVVNLTGTLQACAKLEMPFQSDAVRIWAHLTGLSPLGRADATKDAGRPADETCTLLLHEIDSRGIGGVFLARDLISAAAFEAARFLGRFFVFL